MPDVSLPSTHLEEAELNEYLDKTLDAAENERAARHLAGCALCNGRLEDLRTLFVALDGLPDAPLERDLVKGVLSQIAPPVEAAFSSRARLVLGLQAILAAALAVALWPFIETSYPAPVYQPTIESALLSGMQLVSEWQTGWQALVDALLQQLAILEQWLPQLGALPFSTRQVALLLGISLFAWLAVNERLIGARRTDQ